MVHASLVLATDVRCTFVKLEYSENDSDGHDDLRSPPESQWLERLAGSEGRRFHRCLGLKNVF